MAPKRKAAAAKNAKREANVIKDETAKEKEYVPLVSQTQPTKKVKADTPSSPVKTRGRPQKTATQAKSKEVAKPQETKPTNDKPLKEKKSKDAKAQIIKPAAKVLQTLKKEEEPRAEGSKQSKHIIIEHCKQCNSFKTRAMKVKEDLEVRIQGVKVSINLEKPRKGCFEIRDEQGNIFVSLLDMPRPFKKLKELDLDTTIIDIIEKIM